MRDRSRHYLADTQVLLWAAGMPRKLSPRVQAILQQPSATIYASPVSAYEIIYKHRAGKLPEGREAAQGYEKWLAALGFQSLTLSSGDCAMAASFNVPHADPWDRHIAAQAVSRGMPVLSSDTMFDLFPVTRIW